MGRAAGLFYVNVNVEEGSPWEEACVRVQDLSSLNARREREARRDSIRIT
jgi:hypothetical protein